MGLFLVFIWGRWVIRDLPGWVPDVFRIDIKDLVVIVMVVGCHGVVERNVAAIAMAGAWGTAEFKANITSGGMSRAACHT